MDPGPRAGEVQDFPPAEGRENTGIQARPATKGFTGRRIQCKLNPIGGMGLNGAFVTEQSFPGFAFQPVIIYESVSFFPWFGILYISNYFFLDQFYVPFLSRNTGQIQRQPRPLML